MYATLEQLKQSLDIQGGDEDELLKAALEAAQDTIERVTQRVFEAEADETRYVDYDDAYILGQKLYLPGDLCQITSVVNGDGMEVTPEMYVTLPRLRSINGGVVSLPNSPQARPWYALQLKLSSNIFWAFYDTPEEAIAITGRWAYSIEAPAAIHNATLRLASWMYTQKDSLAPRSDSEVSNHGPLLLMSDLPEDVQRRLLPFMRH